MKRLVKSLVDGSISACSPLLRRRARHLILLYHQLHDPATPTPGRNIDPGMSVDVTALRRQLLWLRGFARFVPLDELVDGHDSRPTNWQVSLTFDDAYRSVFELALPILEELQIPATIFVPAWYAEDDQRMPWWDLAQVAIDSWRAPLSLQLGATSRTFDLASISGCQTFLRELADACYQATPDELIALTVQLRQQLDSRLQLPANGIANADMLAAAAASPLVEIASHGSRHFNAARATTQELADDIAGSIDLLQQWTGQPVRYYSYPYGKDAFRSPDASAIVDSFNFKAAFINDPGYVTPATDLQHLPRLSVLGHWSLPAFRSRVLASNLRTRLAAFRPPKAGPRTSCQDAG